MNIIGEDTRTPTNPAPAAPHARAELRLMILVGLAIGGAGLLAFMLWPFLSALVTASVLALILVPFEDRIRKRWKNPDLSAALTTVLCIVVVVIPLAGVSFLVATQARDALDGLARGMLRWAPLVGQLGARMDVLLSPLGIEGVLSQAWLEERLRALPDVMAGRAFTVARGVGGTILQLAIGLFSLFYLLRDREQMARGWRSLVPLAEAQTDELVTKATRTIQAAVYGHVLVAAVQGGLGALAFWIAGVPLLALWGMLMCILSLIPLVGPAVVWVPTGALLIVSGSVGKGIFVLAFGVLVISTVDNVIRAVLVGGRARVHPLVIFLGVLGGIFAFGAAGIFVGPALFVIALGLLGMARLALFPPAVQVVSQAGPPEVIGEPGRLAAPGAPAST